MTDVYRLWDKDGRLLYIGVATNPGQRFQQHRALKPWWDAVARIELVHYATRNLAFAAEREAILAEEPIHNAVHNGVEARAKAARVEQGNRVETIKTLLADEARQRLRIVDEIDFTITEPYGVCRLQLFVAPGYRSVILATQRPYEGVSLENGAERYVSAAWRLHQPYTARPPILIKRQIEPRRVTRYAGQIITFNYSDDEAHWERTCVTSEHSTWPLTAEWGPGITPDELRTLVNGPVDLDRGLYV